MVTIIVPVLHLSSTHAMAPEVTGLDGLTESDMVEVRGMRWDLGLIFFDRLKSHHEYRRCKSTMQYVCNADVYLSIMTWPCIIDQCDQDEFSVKAKVTVSLGTQSQLIAQTLHCAISALLISCCHTNCGLLL